MDSYGRWPGFFQKRNRRDAEDELENEIISIVEEGQESGALPKEEADMIQKILGLGEKQAHDIMVRRNNISAIESTVTLREAINYMIEENKSRFPVYKEDLDDVIGMIHLRSTLIASMKPVNLDRTIEEIPDILYDAYFIPETKGLNQLFAEMQKSKNHLAIVIDEYGQTAGLLTMEDILEEIVGNIMDECDEEQKSITKARDGSYLMVGTTLLEEVEELLNIDFEDKEYKTLNGFLVNKLEHIPSAEEKPQIFYKGYLFEVVSVDNNMIQTVRVTEGRAGISKRGT